MRGTYRSKRSLIGRFGPLKKKKKKPLLRWRSASAEGEGGAGPPSLLPSKGKRHTPPRGEGEMLADILFPHLSDLCVMKTHG